MQKPKPVKILHLLSQRPDSTGSGIYLQAMLRESEAAGHKNYLVAGVQAQQPAELDCIDPRQCSFIRFFKADISFPIVGMSDVMPYESQQFCNLSANELDEYEASFAKTLKAAVDIFDPDIIHSHHLWIMTSLARRLFPGIPMVSTCHGSDLRQFQNCTHLQERVLSGCSRLEQVMALSRVQEKEIQKLYHLSKQQVSVVGAGYNDSLFSNQTKPAATPIQLAYAGKLSRAKGVPWLLRALSKINTPDWQLHLVGGGSGPEKEECLQLARDLGQRVLIYGRQSQENLAAIMKRAHIFVLPSFYEGLPLVLLEALACGCRLVATDLPGVKEIFGQTETDFIQMVRTPRLQNLDRPHKKDESAFMQHLTHALQAQMAAANQKPQIDLDTLQQRMASFSWAGVFKKVQDIYCAVHKPIKTDR